MRETRLWQAAMAWPCRRPWLATLLAITCAWTLAGAPAQANVGYELSTSKSLSGKIPHGIAVDQASRRIYVAIVATSPGPGAFGEINRFESNLSASGIFAKGSEPFYSGVAVNPLTQGFYGAEARVHTPFAVVGTPQMDLFSSSGTPGITFALTDTATLPQIATDSSGDVYYPNAATNTVQVFDSAGALQEEIACTGCPGGAFGKPASVALNSEDDLYVADLSPDRVVKFTSSGGSYTYSSILQSGRGAAAVAVDPSDDSVFVGDLPNGKRYHIVAYDPSGTQFDDFGAGVFSEIPAHFGAVAAGQIAVDATSHRLYATDGGFFYIFDRGTIDPPDATIEPASPVGQLTATLRATVNANGHAALECEFEYTDDADFQANGFANASAAPCPKAPDGSDDTELAVEVSGLSPVTVYHYRLTVTTNAGSVTTGGETFETLPVVAPTVTTEPALAVGESGATLKGTVNPHGGSVSDCHFEFGTSASYGSDLPCSALPGPVSTGVVETLKISKLTSGTSYHYRLVVTSNAGTTEGKDVEFKTASPPPPPDTSDPPPSGDPPASTPPPPVVSPTPPPRPLHCRKGFRKKRVRGKLKCVKKKRHAKRRQARK